MLSDDGKEFRQVYQHDGTVFHGFEDKKPLVVALKNARARYVRLALPGKSYLHLDEVEVYRQNRAEEESGAELPGGPGERLAMVGGPQRASSAGGLGARAKQTLAVCERLAGEVAQVSALTNAVAIARSQTATRPPGLRRVRETAAFSRPAGCERRLALRNPLLGEFDTLLFTKRVPGSFNHMSDQYYGWWSKPGGGIYLLRGFTTDHRPSSA